MPWQAGEVNPLLLDLVSGFAPDYLAVVPKTFADWRVQEPDRYAAWAARQPFVLDAEDREAAERTLSEHVADEPVDRDGRSGCIPTSRWPVR